MRPVTEVCVVAVLFLVNSVALAETVSEESSLFQLQGGPYSQDNGPMYTTLEACERDLTSQQTLARLAGIPLSNQHPWLARCFKIYFCVKNGTFTSPCRATVK
jgi:hypothetical protein